MKSKKHFQKWMFCATALLMVAPLASQSQHVHASMNDVARRPGITSTYGIAPDAKTGKGGLNRSSGKMGVVLRYNEHGHGTANANYIHKHKLSGFLVRTNKVIHGRPFGPTKSKFKVSMEGDKGHRIPWVVYMYPKESEAGKVGMYYKDALFYYPNSKKGRRLTLDARLFWNGSYRPNGIGAHNSLHFSTRNISIKEPYQGAANFTLKLYHNGKPFKAIKTQIMQTDIDYKQGLIFDPPQYLIYDKSTALNAGYIESWNTNVPGKIKVFGDQGTHHGKQGTVYPEQKQGQISYVPRNPTNSFNVTFVHSYESIPLNYQSHRFASPSGTSTGYDPDKLQTLPVDYDTKKYYQTTQQLSGGQADYFGFEFDKGKTNSTYNVPVNKLVNTKDNHFKKVKQSSPLTVKDNQKIYFDIHTQLQGPSSAYVKEDNSDENYNGLPLKDALKDKSDPNLGKAGLTDAGKNKQRLVLKDSLDPSLELAGDPKIVYAENWNDTTLKGKRRDASKYFYVHHAKDKHGRTVVDAVLKPDAAKAKSDAWWKDYHLIIPVKLKKGAQPAHGSYSGGWTLIHNKALINDHGGDDGGNEMTIDKIHRE
ncbi:hypothetical protein [Lactobacillus sp. LL6]|uniref:hypothetical protein n=1 Tax=Lactobacillus sp. LL6 TaxID=2596827 RepID=UPI0011847539|nr:hypothetical protein [Lactobacillus sp. LL6]TSO25409.1 hypothetical protein FOD82_09270 [Lactobacillus sp. LL6]